MTKKNILRLALLALLAITLFGEQAYAQTEEEETPEETTEETGAEEEPVDEGPLDPVIDIDEKWLLPFKEDDPNTLSEEQVTAWEEKKARETA